jgi:hypothetical protein
MPVTSLYRNTKQKQQSGILKEKSDVQVTCSSIQNPWLWVTRSSIQYDAPFFHLLDGNLDIQGADVDSESVGVTPLA